MNLETSSQLHHKDVVFPLLLQVVISNHSLNTALARRA